LQQLVPGAASDDGRVDVAGLAGRLSPELVQLWYQMAISGRRDLGLAPSPRTGFEMSLLRMLAFRPAGGGSGGGLARGAGAGAPVSPAPASAAAPAFAPPPRSAPAPQAALTHVPAAAATAPAAPTPATARSGNGMAGAPGNGAGRRLASAEDWLSLVAKIGRASW